jgi:hypothetical protein
VKRIVEQLYSELSVRNRKCLKAEPNPGFSLYHRKIGEGLRSVPTVLKRKRCESWLQSWLADHCPAVLERGELEKDFSLYLLF